MVGASWVDRAEYPFESHWFEVGKKRLHYVDEGHGEPILFLHGTPTWSFYYRHLIRGLRQNYRCIALDQIGFGLSDKPANWSYRPERDLEYVTDFIESKNLQGVTLVMSGMGGSIGMGYAVEHPENVKHLLIMNSWMWPLDDLPSVQKVDHTVNGPFGRSLYLTWNCPVRCMKRNIIDRTHVGPTALQHYAAALDDSSERVGPYGYDKALLGSSNYYKSLWAKREAVKHIPAMLLWGMADKVLPPSSIEKWQMVFPELEVKKLTHCGPYICEEKGPGLTHLVEMLLTDTVYLPTATLM